MKTVVVGAGLGGLECGLMLARAGDDVTVLEQGRQPGGCLQTFVRGTVRFDTGFHYVGGLEPDGALGVAFRELGLDGLPWHRLDEDCIDEIHIGNDVFRIPAGYEAYVDYLAGLFPGQRAGLERMVALMRQVGEGIFAGSGVALSGQSARDWLCGTISDPLLRQVICGAFLRLPYDAGALSLYAFAQINHSYLRGAWRLQGGGSVLTDRLCALLAQAGGRVLCGKQVVRIREDAVLCLDGSEYPADLIISDLHPARTVDLLPDHLVRRSYTTRLRALRDSGGVLSTQIRLRPGCLPYRNYNLFLHRPGTDVWQPSPDTGIDRAMIHYGVPSGDGRWAETLDILVPASLYQPAEVDAACTGWTGVPFSDAHFKAEMARRCMDFARPVLEGLDGAVDGLYVSTPHTWERYTGTRGGSAFGTVKDWRDPLTTILSVKTPLRNLFLTGQNVNLHGVLGVTMTARRTCAQILQER